MKKNFLTKTRAAVLGFLFALFVAALVSCAQERGNTIALSFDARSIKKSLSSRDIYTNSDPDAEVFYIVASIRGGYTQTRSVTLSWEDMERGMARYTLEFDSIPTGAEVYVEANVYDPSTTSMASAGAGAGDYFNVQHGISASFAVSSGESEVVLRMRDMTSGDSDWTAHGVSGNSSENLGSYTLTLYSNGKYQAGYSTDLLSEGVWQGASLPSTQQIPAGTTVRLMELGYRTYTRDSTRPDNPSGWVIVERPVWRSVTIKENEQGTYIDIGSSKFFD